MKYIDAFVRVIYGVYIFAAGLLLFSIQDELWSLLLAGGFVVSGALFFLSFKWSRLLKLASSIIFFICIYDLYIIYHGPSGFHWLAMDPHRRGNFFFNVVSLTIGITYLLLGGSKKLAVNKQNSSDR